VIHTREADADTLTILREERRQAGPGIRFGGCCTALPHARPRASRPGLGFYVSLAGIVTFPKAADLRATAAPIPLDRLLVETDQPFLAPVPHRGKRNEPAHVTKVVEALAPLYGVEVDELAGRTTANFHTLFGP